MIFMNDADDYSLKMYTLFILTPPASLAMCNGYFCTEE